MNKPDKLNYNIVATFHLMDVEGLMKKVATELRSRGLRHDRSKYSGIEHSVGTTIFKECDETEAVDICNSEGMIFGEGDKEDSIDRLIISSREAHFSINDHHPEHFEHGLTDMNLLQVMEMTCDLVAHGKSLSYSVEECKDFAHRYLRRYDITEGHQSAFLESVILNTVEYLYENG